jgi:hypothetical protein
MAIPLPAILKAFGCSRTKLNKWRSEDHLAADIPDGSPGVASMVSREVGLEIAFMSVLTGAGYGPSDAKIHARNWLRLHKEKGLDPVWVFDPMAGMLAVRGSGAETIKAVLAAPREQIEMPLGTQNRSSMVLRVFNLGEVLARLDEIEHEYKQIASM